MLSLQLLVSFLSITLVNGRPAREVKGLGLPIINADAANIIPNKYIVVYHSNLTSDVVTNHQQSVMSTMTKRGLDNSKCKMLGLNKFRAMAMEFDDDGLVMDIASANEVREQVYMKGRPQTNFPRSIISRQIPRFS